MPKLWITRRSEPTKYVEFKKPTLIKNELKVNFNGYKCTIFYTMYTKTINVPFYKHGTNKLAFHLFPISVKGNFQMSHLF